jgi:hypothetical protein
MYSCVNKTLTANTNLHETSEGLFGMQEFHRIRTGISSNQFTFVVVNERTIIIEQVYKTSSSGGFCGT